MPFPTTVTVTRTLAKPAGPAEALLERLAAACRAEGLGGVSAGQAVVRFEAAPAALAGEKGDPLLSSGEIEVIDRGDTIELVAEADIGRLPLAFGTGTLVAATLGGGLHAISLTGGLVGGALIAVVPWLVARYRLQACLRRAALAAGEQQPATAGRLPH